MLKFQAVLLASCFVLTSSVALAQTDREAIEGMQNTASLACPDYSTDRANAAIAHVSPDALRVLSKHNIVLCPDRRLTSDQALIWYPRVSALVWSPANQGAAAALAQTADKLTRKEDFPQALTVWDAKGNPLKNQVVPQFDFKPNFRR